MTRMPESQPSVIAEKVGAVRILTLNRPEKLNAADLEMQQRLLGHLEEVAADKQARALILTGAGRAFSAGGDRDILRRIAEGKEDRHAELARIHVATIRCLLGLEIPAIAAVSGPALGYAAGLVALCDLVVMGANGFLGDPHVHYGIPATTACQLIWPRRASEGIVRDILMTGRKVPAEEAVAIGLANRLCPAGEERTTALEIAQGFAALPAAGIAQTKRAFNRPLFAALDELLEQA
ncbi:MAG: enoyl-CoA hydratase/isomerase family protein [Sphingomonadales bacterium]|nr:enoyl-CoA hydratase/isomerase family protein [Sphingomonadales bacterium]